MVPVPVILLTKERMMNPFYCMIPTFRTYDTVPYGSSCDSVLVEHSISFVQIVTTFITIKKESLKWKKNAMEQIGERITS